MAKKHPHDKGITLAKSILKTYPIEELASVLGGMRGHLANELRKLPQSIPANDALIQIK